MPKKNGGDDDNITLLPTYGDGGESDDLDFDEDLDDLYEEDDAAGLNDPSVKDLPEPPLVGMSPGQADIFGARAQGVGMASSPKLMTQAARFPTATQLRIWKIEDGNPVGLGVIDADASEEELVRKFFSAMPRPGQGKAKFQLRPVDIHGNELGKQSTIIISEHHATIQQMRDELKEQESGMNFGGRGGYGPGGDVYVQGGSGDGAGASYAEEMGRMFEQAVGAADERTRQLQQSLEMERERLRVEEQRRAEERLHTAERATDVVTKMTDRLMESDRARSDEALRNQQRHSEMMTNTLTTVFQQQNAAQREQAERMRELDRVRMEQDRAYFDQQRQEAELRRQMERDEAERRRQEEKDRAQAELERREAELRARAEERRMEIERERQRMAEERERWRVEIEERRRLEQMEWERKQAVAREEAQRIEAVRREESERKERLDRERWEREKAEMQQRAERERLEFERKREEERRLEEQRAQERREELARIEATRREEAEKRERVWREELEAREARRKEDMLMQMKNMELQAQQARDAAALQAQQNREYNERMAEMARLERDAQREAQAAREKAEREDREFREKERDRKYQLQMRELELSKEQQREHAERMLHLSKMQAGGGLGGLGEMLGMQTPELLERIFGGGGSDGEEGGGGWLENIPKMLGSFADLGSKMVSRSEGRQPIPQIPQYVTMPDPRVQAAQPVPQPPPPQAPPEEVEEEIEDDEPDLTPYEAGKAVDTLARAKEAGISLLTQRKCRKTLTKLSEALREIDLDSEEGVEDVVGKVSAAVMTTPELLDYINAVTVYAAFAETGADEELCDKIVDFMRESEMVPEDMIYDEEDYAMSLVDDDDVEEES